MRAGYKCSRGERENTMEPRPTTRGEVLLRLDGVFDVPAARRVEKLLEKAKAGETVRLDLTHVREFHDFGIAVLAQALKHGKTCKVALLGLRQHQLRMLRYFGVDGTRYGAGPAAAASSSA